MKWGRRGRGWRWCVAVEAAVSKICEFLGALFRRRDVQRLLVVRVEVARVARTFRLGQERCLDLPPHSNAATTALITVNNYSDMLSK